MGIQLAAYGTLMTGETSELSPTIRRRMVSHGQCLIPGRLFRVRNPGGFDYPALVAAPGFLATGELFIVPAADLPMLDLYEDFQPADPAASRYIRRRLTVRVGPFGVSAWVYVWNRSVSGLRPVPGNAWGGPAAGLRAASA